MSDKELGLLLALVLVHFISDFPLQKSLWVTDKNKNHFKSGALYIHGVIHALLATLILVLFSVKPFGILIGAGVIGVSHILIDGIKSYADQKKVRWFLLDQAAHILVIASLIIWGGGSWPEIKLLLSNFIRPDFQIMIVSFVIAIWPLSLIVSMICRKWSDQIPDDDHSLENAGNWIGRLERILILAFIFAGHFSAIGFLLAAKSILRYDSGTDSMKRRRNEYILIGTLTSFALTIMLGLAGVIIIEAQ